MKKSWQNKDTDGNLIIIVHKTTVQVGLETTEKTCSRLGTTSRLKKIRGSPKAIFAKEKCYLHKLEKLDPDPH
jgi:hypothetical protein